MNRLYIIGNGFDRYHELPTGYCDFHEYVENNLPDLENDMEEYFQLRKDDNNLWSDFEKDLSTFNYKTFFKDNKYFDCLDDKFKQSQINCLEDDIKQETEELIERIKEGFENWISNIELENIKEKLELEKESFFLNFNYTLTLEKVYNIPIKNIFHIHGDIENNEGFLIFGHNKTLRKENEIDKNNNSKRTQFSDSENSAKYPFYKFQKPVNDIIKNNNNYFKRLGKIKEIIILGHSLNSIDIPYLKKIKKYTPNTIWKVSYYNEDEKQMHLKALQGIGMNKSDIIFFKMDQIKAQNPRSAESPA